MAYVNVLEWKPEQVTEWLKGLDNAVLPYIHSFLNNEVSGQQLLNLRPDDLDHLGVHKLGHQELILEAVEHLRNFHYELDRENLQLLALRLACRAHSLHNELKDTTESLVTTQTLADVANIITAVKPLVCWLDRSPFSGHLDYQDRKSELLKLSLEIATVAHRDRFSEAPVKAIREFSRTLAEKADSIIQDIVDPLILQPASLDLATLKKRAGDDLGILIVPSFHGVHQIAEIKYSSPAHSCGKIEEGDEVVQVNYQTVVGWQTKQVMALFEECPTDVFLTLKKRPRHTKVYGQIYMKPYRLPSKKRAAQYTRWHDNLPSPRPELLTIPDFEMPLPRAAPKQAAVPVIPLLECEPHSESSDEDDDSFLASNIDPGASPTSMRLYLPKPRVTVQRRATVTGASPTNKRPPINVQQFWRELRLERQWKEGSDGSGGGPKEELYQLRDKSASFGNGFNLENPPRPSTCLGIENSSNTPMKLTKQRAIITKDQNGNKKVIKPMENITENSPVRTNKRQNDQGEELLEMFRNQHGYNLQNADDRKIDPKLFLSGSYKDESNKQSNVVAQTGKSVKKDVRFEGAFDDLMTGENLRGDDNCMEDLDICDIIDKTDGSEQFVEWNDTSSEKGCSTSSSSTKERGRLDKSYSTPAYDTSEPESMESSPIEKSFPPKLKPKPTNIVNLCKANVAVEKFENVPDVEETNVEERKMKKVGSILETINTALLEHRLQEDDIIEDDLIRPRAYRSSGLPDYHEVTNGEFMTELERCNKKSLQLSFENKKQYEAVQICVTPPEPPPRTMPSFDQSRAGMSNSSQSKPSTSTYDQAKAGSSQVDQGKNSASSSDQAKVIIINTDTKSSPTSSGETVKVGGAGYRVMQVAKSLGINGGVFSGSASLPSPRSTRKKNALLAKRRNVGVTDVGVADVEGWLFHRRRSSGANGATWHKGWFVLKGSTFYGFNAQKSPKAHLMIALPGFTSSLAQEVKSRKFAFKVYHTGTVFYFAAETEEELATWLETISTATIRQEISTNDTVVFSESDEGSDSELPLPSPKVRKFGGFLGGHSNSQQQITDAKSSEIQKKFGSLKKLGRKQDNGSSPTQHDMSGAAASSLDRKYLRIFGSSRNNVPVPTAQFRSYRRIANTPLSQPSRIPSDNYEDPSLSPTNTVGTSFSDLSSTKLKSPAPGSESPSRSQFYLSAESVFHDTGIPESVKKSSTFHDINSLNSPPSYETVIKETGYVPPMSPPISTKLSPTFINNNTRESTGERTISVEFRTKKQENTEGAQSPKSDKSDKSSCFRGSNTVSRSSKPSAKQEKIQNRAKNLDYRERQIHASNPSLLIPSEMSDYRLAAERLREFGIRRNRQREDTSGFVTLEEFMLSRQEEERRQRGHMGGAQTVSNTSQAAVQSAANNGNTAPSHSAVSVQRKGSFNSTRVKREEQREYRGGSPEKFWIDSLRRSDASRKPISLKNSQVSDVNSNQLRLKNAAQYQPPPVKSPNSHTNEDTPKMKLAFEMHLDKSSNHDGGNTTKSKFRNLFTSTKTQNKHHILETQAISPGIHQKTLLGSPRLHRAIFRDKRTHVSKNATSDSSSSSLSSPASPPFDWPIEGYLHQSDVSGTQIKPTMGVSMIGKKPSRRTLPPSPSPSQSSPPPDYPGLEYPPVFEPETYTLTDASSLMRSKKTH